MEIKWPNQQVNGIFIAAVLLTSLAYGVAAQPSKVNADVSSVLFAWNKAHNDHDHRALESIYDNTVIVGGKALNRAACIASKKRVFHSNPDFSQTISDVKYRTHGENVVQCSYNIRLVKNGAVWKYPAYVLVVLKNNRFRIAAESDDDTNTTLALYHRTARTPVAAVTKDKKQKAGSRTASLSADSVVSKPASGPTVVQHPRRDSVVSKRTDSQRPRNRASLPAVATDTLSIPMHYVYTIGGTLVVLAIFILVAGVGSKKRRQIRAARLSQQREPFDKVQAAQFEKFVITLFDPKYFRVFRGRPERVLQEGGAQVVNTAELELEFNHQETHAGLFIRCEYLPALKHRVINVFPEGRSSWNREQGSDGTSRYVILGLEGKPEDPKEIYLIPLNEVSEPFLTYPELQRFRKYGMFFYNAMTERLQ